MKSLKKASTFTPLAGPVSTKAPGAAFPPPGPRAPTGPAQAARTSCGKGQRGFDTAITVLMLSDTQDFRERTKHFCEITHAGSMNSAGSIDDYLKIK